jgi:hypothetical protein
VVFVCFNMIVYDICCIFSINKHLRKVNEVEVYDPIGLTFSKNIKLNQLAPKMSKNKRKKKKKLEVKKVMGRRKLVPTMRERKFISVVEFMRDGIKMKKMDTFYGKYYNWLFLLRLMSFEPIFVSLQMLPKAQVTCIFGIQFFFCVFTYSGIFYKKIFLNHVIAFEYWLNETFITLFMVLCMYIVYGGVDQLSVEKWAGLQRVTVTGVIIVSAINLLIFAVTLVGTIRLLTIEINKKKGKHDTLRSTVRNSKFTRALLPDDKDSMDMEIEKKKRRKKKKYKENRVISREENQIKVKKFVNKSSEKEEQDYNEAKVRMDS